MTWNASGAPVVPHAAQAAPGALRCLNDAINSARSEARLNVIVDHPCLGVSDPNETQSPWTHSRPQD